MPLIDDRRTHILAVLGLALLTGLLYAQTLDDDWHFDDRAELTPAVRELAPRVEAAHYRGNVVRWLWAFDWRISGDDPRGYHVTNVLLHFLNSLLVYRLAWLLGAGGSRPREVALAAGAIFCAHPLATQSVTYITQRSTSLATLFFLLSLTSWIAFRRGDRGRWHAVSSLVAFAIGLHAKHVVMMVPVAILSYELLFRPARRRGAFALLAAFVVLGAVRFVDHVPHLRGAHAIAGRTPAVSSAASASRHGSTEYALTQPRSILTYARLFVWPSGQNLDHHVEAVRSARSAAFLLPLAALVAMATLAWHGRRDRPIAAFGIALFFVALVPTSSIVRSPDLLFEHRAYLPMAGLCLAFADASGALRSRRRGVWVALVAALVVAFGLATLRRNAVWDTELSLWSDVAAKSPGKARPHVNLALALQHAGRYDDAERVYRRALALGPDNATARNNLGNVLRRLGRVDEAKESFEAALAIRPGYAEPRLNLGNLAMDRGDFKASERWYREAIELAPREPALRSNLAKALEGQGRWQEAIGEYDRLVAARPDDAQFVNDRGCAHLVAGDFEAAERDLERAIELRPEWDAPRHNLELARGARRTSTGGRVPAP